MMIHKFMTEELGFAIGVVDDIMQDIKAVTEKYRNPAAHAKRLDRKVVDEFRNVLLCSKEPLIARLARMSVAAEVWSPRSAD
jgi:hypothetical protein